MKGGTDRRWLSPDPRGGDITNPQPLNRYAYALNNPTTLTDPSGLGPCSDNNNNCNQGPPGGPFDPPCSVVGMATICYPPGGATWTYPQLSGMIGNWDEFDLVNVPVVTQTWVPPTQVGITMNGVTAWGAVSPGYWMSTTVGNALEFMGGMRPSIPGIQFTPTSQTTATFTSQLSFAQTVSTFKRAGFVQNPEDYIDFFHPNQLDLRDKLAFCSTHVAINKASGLVPTSATTGDSHVDTINPWAPSPFPSFDEPGGLTLPLGHLLLDVFKLYPGAVACRP